MMNALKKIMTRIYVHALSCHARSELRQIEKLLKRHVPATVTLTDIGCGKGRGLQAFQRLGYPAIGVEINATLRSYAQNLGFHCISPDDFLASSTSCQTLCMMHFIEHFSPNDLLPLLESYLDKLSPGGFLLIATPMPTRAFYYDFDHIRPYLPLGIEMVFGSHTEQVQYYARHRLQRLELGYARGPLSGYSLLTHGALSAGLTLAGLILFYSSGGLIGYRSSWIALYQKMP